MYSYDPIHKDWYYSFVEIPNLLQIQKELINLRKTCTRFHQTNPYYLNAFRINIGNSCPELYDYLRSKKILGFFTRILFSRPPSRIEPPVVHVDGYNPKTRIHMALNLPLLNCENTYTGFYHTEKKHLVYTAETVDNYAWLPLQEVKEVKKVEIVRPVIVNTTILHAAISSKPERLIASIRFNRPLNEIDMKNLGVKKPFVQED